MKAAVLLEPGRVEVQEDYPEPTPLEGDVVVEVELCGICGSDLMDWYVAGKAPAVLGHEIVGRVAAVQGGTDPRIEVGQRVFVHHHVPCGRCRRCRRGRETLCTSFKASRIVPGGFAERVLVPAAHVRDGLLLLPDGLAAEVATLIEPLACALRAIERSGVRAGDRALIVGLGQMGQIYGRALVSRGVEVSGTDPDTARQVVAHAAGIILAGTGAAGRSSLPPSPASEDPFDLVAVCSANLGALDAGLDAVGPATTLQLFAPPPPGVQWSVEPNRIFFDEVTIQASYSAGPGDTRAALGLLSATGRFDATGLVSCRYGLDEIARAFHAAHAGGTVLKVVVEVGGEQRPVGDDLGPRARRGP